MKPTFKILAACALASSVILGASAEDDVDAALADMAAQRARAAKGGQFYTIPLCRIASGVVRVRRPNDTAWVDAEEGKYYPLGSQFCTIGPDSTMTLSVGVGSEVVLGGDSSFGTLKQDLGVSSRTITIGTGVLDVKLQRNLPEGLFVISSRGFKVVNPSGESTYTSRKCADGEEIDIRCVTGTLTVEGAHFSLPSLQAANQVRVRTSEDALATIVSGLVGDILAKLDAGMVEERDLEKNETHIVKKLLDWHLRPSTVVRIMRSKPSIGDKFAVSTMTFDDTGSMRNRFTYLEDSYQLNTGDEGPKTEAEKKALEKKADKAVAADEAGEALAGDDAAQGDMKVDDF